MIDTKLLRQKILDLAIRGKLVPQDPKDEPASELLKKIKAEKEALTKAGKLKRDKHESFIFRGDDKHYYEQIDGKTIDITDEIPFDIPETWEWCRLHEVCAENSVGIVIRPTQYYTTSDKGIPAFRNANIKPNKIDDTNWIYLSYYGIQENPRCIVHENNLLISRSGNAGTCCVATKKYDGYGAVDILLISLSSFCSSFFISYCINSPFFQHKISQNNRGVALSHIGTNTVAKILLPLPPLAEQKRIVGQIENLLKCADEIDQESTTLEKSLVLAKQKVLDLAIRGKLVPQNPEDESASELLKRIKAEKEALVRAGKIKRDRHESYIFKGDDNCYHENIDGKVTDITEDIPFDLPDEWEWCRLSTISEFDLGKTLDRQKNTGNYRKYLRSVNVLWGNIDLSDVKEMRFEDTELERYSIKKGDLLICEGGDVGRCAVWDKDFVFYYQNALHRVRFYQKCISLFFQFVMMFFENTGLLKEISQGVTIKHLTKNTLNSMFFPLPPLAEQKRIVSQVEKLFTVLETMRG